jgi:hypothetical protein
LELGDETYRISLDLDAQLDFQAAQVVFGVTDLREDAVDAVDRRIIARPSPGAP